MNKVVDYALTYSSPSQRTLGDGGAKHSSISFRERPRVSGRKAAVTAAARRAKEAYTK